MYDFKWNHDQLPRDWFVEWNGLHVHGHGPKHCRQQRGIEFIRVGYSCGDCPGCSDWCVRRRRGRLGNSVVDSTEQQWGLEYRLLHGDQFSRSGHVYDGKWQHDDLLGGRSVEWHQLHVYGHRPK